MKRIVKILAYVVLIACAVSFGYAFITHLPKAKEIPEVDEPGTVAPSATTNTAPATNNIVATNLPAASTNKVAAAPPARPVAPKPPSSNWGTYLGLFLLSSICLGILVAYDIARFLAHRAEQFVFDENLVHEKDPEYEEAEKIWANGQPLEAVQLMRDFLKKNPHAQYVALRIAEIYEKDLANYLAAALEYEEVLKKKLPPERWGWAAIHLANLYSGKLNKVPQAEALLHRIVEEYPKTGAAKKARERLGIPEPIEEPPPPPPEVKVVQKEPEPEPPPPPPPQSNLPRGFRPKD